MKRKTLCSKLVSLKNELISAKVYYKMGVALYKVGEVGEGEGERRNKS